MRTLCLTVTNSGTADDLLLNLPYLWTQVSMFGDVDIIIRKTFDLDVFSTIILTTMPVSIISGLPKSHVLTDFFIPRPIVIVSTLQKQVVK